MNDKLIYYLKTLIVRDGSQLCRGQLFFLEAGTLAGLPSTPQRMQAHYESQSEKIHE